MTDVWSRDQGPEQVTVYVSFGPKPTQVISLEVASDLLSLWREEEPHRFGYFLAKALTGTNPGRNRSKS